MGKGKELTEQERAFIAGMARGGASISKIAAAILRRFQGRENFKTGKQPGRSSIKTPRDERSLTSLVKENCRTSAKDLAKRWVAII